MFFGSVIWISYSFPEPTIHQTQATTANFWSWTTGENRKAAFHSHTQLHIYPGQAWSCVFAFSPSASFQLESTRDCHIANPGIEGSQLYSPGACHPNSHYWTQSLPRWFLRWFLTRGPGMNECLIITVLMVMMYEWQGWMVFTSTNSSTDQVFEHQLHYSLFCHSTENEWMNTLSFRIRNME